MKGFFTLFLILLINTSFATDKYDLNKVYDSLARLLPLAKGTQRVDILCKMAYILTPYEPDSCQPMSEEILSLSSKLNYPTGIGKAYQIKGEIAFYNDNYTLALDYYNRAVDIFRTTDEKKELAKTLGQIGTIYLFTNNVEKGMAFIPEMISLYQQGHYLDELAMVYNAIGFYHNNYSKDGKAAIDVIRKSLSLAIQEQLPSRYPGAVSASLALAYANAGQYDSARINYHKSLKYFNDSIQADRVLKTETLWVIGKIMSEYMKSDSALYYFEKALGRANNLTFLWGVYRTADLMANYYFQKNEIEKAIRYYELAAKNALKVNATGFAFEDETYRRAPISFWDLHIRNVTASILRIEAKEGLAKSYKMLSYLAERTGNFKKGLEYFKLFNIYSDTLNQIANDKQLLGLEISYETERKNQQINMLEQQSELQEYRFRQNRFFLYGLGIALVLVLLFAILFFRQNRIKSNQQAILLKQRLFRSQMNPHFIFNSLASIQNSIINEEPIKASKYLAKFSKLVRNILDSSVEEFIPLEEEVNTIENYLALQKIRFPEKFDYSIEVDEAIDAETIRIPPMLAQPFIENAIEHGIKLKDSKGNIQVHFRLQNEMLVLEIEDDGIGRKKAQEILQKQNDNHKSLATSITQQRIAVLNKERKGKIQLSIFDLTNEAGEATGTMVRINIPITF
ncbi:MAG: histidine kinase [Bacteroidales bacterium]